MKYFRPSIVSTIVCSTLAAAAVNAAGTQTGLNHYDATSRVNQAKNLGNTVSQYNLSQRKTRSGMQSHYDAKMGKATFLWAADQQARPALGAIAPEQRDAYAAEFYLNNLTGLTTNKSPSNRAILSNLHQQGQGAVVAKYKQEVFGVEVFNREFNVMMDQERSLVAASGYLVDDAAVRAYKKLPNINGQQSATDALKNAFAAMGGDPASLDATEVQSDDPANKYSGFEFSHSADGYQLVGKPRAKKTLFELDGQLIPAYYVELEAGNAESVSSDYMAMVVSTIDGRILYRNNLTNSEAAFGYRVYAETDNGHLPLDGPMGDVSPWNPADEEPTQITDASLITLASGPISTNDPWLAEDATITSGNNVNAYVDAIAPQGFSNGDYHAEITSANTFDYVIKTDEPHNSVANRKAAIVNLFYVNNYLHDQFYDHGFDETSGNAQVSNYGRGGVEGDPLNAEAQDNSGFNNANMSTPADGAAPRMQMYLYDDHTAKVGTDYGVSIVATGDGEAKDALLNSTQLSNFGARRYAKLQGKAVRLVDGDDSDGTIYDGCQAPTNAADLAGNIAVIDRGACNFTAKVKFAQEAGAIAALIANDDRDPTGTSPSPMGGDDDTVRIPNAGLSFNDGKAIYDALDAGQEVTVAMFNETPFRDGTFDNGTIAHEWGHYISNRLVGNSSGLINNQGRSMGEGWGDFHALLLMVRAEDAQRPGNDKFQAAYSGSGYTDSFYAGIRRAPYSTQKTINPLTFKHIERDAALPEGVRDFGDNAEVHAAGEIWTLALWEGYVGLINDERYTFEQAQSLMMDYLVAGYKMTPVAPTYTEARDAILAAAYAKDMQDYKVLLQGFANRGLGLGAVSPDRYSDTHAGVVESDKVDLATYALTKLKLDTAFESMGKGYCTNDNMLDNGETATLTLTVANRGNKLLENVKAKIEVDGPQTVTFANDGIVTFDTMAPYTSAISTPIELTLADAGMADNLKLKITFPELVEGDDIVEAGDDTLAVTVNLDFKDRALNGDSDIDDVEGLTSLHDWKENVMFGGELAEGTQSIDTAGAAYFSSVGIDTGAQMLYLNNNGFKSDVAMETRTFSVGYQGDFSVNWWHYFDLEESWDGGVVEVSINGGEWIDATAVGGTFTGNGYNGELRENPDQALSTRKAFTGFSNGAEGINFGEALNGNEVRFRFRIGADAFANEDGWYIDNIRFTNINSPVYSDPIAGDSVSCDNRMPYITMTSGADIQERASVGGALNTGELSVVAEDPDNQSLTYSWSQVSGSTATLANADQATATFTAPSITTDETLVFEVTVSDGVTSAKKQVSVNVTNVADAAAVQPKKSSGGSMGWLALLLAPLAMLRRRKR